MGVLFYLFEIALHALSCYCWIYLESLVTFIAVECGWLIVRVLTTLKPTRNCQLPDFSQINEKTERFLLENYQHILPAVLYHPDVEKAKWLNDCIRRLWTPINRALQKHIKEHLLDLVKKELRKNTSLSFKFVTIDLGTVPFKVLGVKSNCEDVDSKKDEISLDVDIAYNGDAAFVFQLGFVRGGIQKIQVRGCMRIVFRPLLNEVPIVSAVSLFFLKRPTLQYEFTNFLHFLNFDAISRLLDRIINRLLHLHVVAPNGFRIKLVKSTCTHDREVNLPIGAIRIHLISAFQLQSGDLVGVSHPTVHFRFGKYHFKSKEAREDPTTHEWDQYFQFPVYREDDNGAVRMEVYDKENDHAIPAVSLGHGDIDLSRIQVNGILEEFYHLNGVPSGVVYLQFEWLDLSMDANDLYKQVEIGRKIQTRTESKLAAGLCFVVLKDARALPLRADLSEPSPEVLIRYGQEEKTSSVARNKRNPVWNETFILPIYNLVDDDLVVEIVDAESPTVLIGSVVLKLSRVLTVLNLKLYEDFSFLPNSPSATVTMSVLIRTFTPPNDVSWNFNELNAETAPIGPMRAGSEFWLETSETSIISSV